MPGFQAQAIPFTATYEPRDASRTVLYKVVANHLETFLASLDADPDAKGLPAYVVASQLTVVMSTTALGRIMHEG